MSQHYPYQTNPNASELSNSMEVDSSTQWVQQESLFSSPRHLHPSSSTITTAVTSHLHMSARQHLQGAVDPSPSNMASQDTPVAATLAASNGQPSTQQAFGNSSLSDITSHLPGDNTFIVNLTTAEVSAPAPTTTPTRSKGRDQLLSGTLMFRTPLPIATIVIHGSEFFVHSELLCKHSAYFVGCLRGRFAEATTQRVEINDEDLSVEDFGLWVDLLYRWHFHKPDTFVLRKEETGGTLSTMQLLTLWKLSDRFLHKPLASLVEESLQHRLSLYSVEQWRKLYRTRPGTDIKSRVNRLQDAYRYCYDQRLPFIDAIVLACANCPPQVYDDYASILEKDFMEQVSRRMIMAHADNSLMSKEQRTVSVPHANGHSTAGGGGGGGSSGCVISGLGGL